MARVKIKSNPYDKKIFFEKFDESGQYWKTISYQENQNSELISDKTSKSFLTFTIKGIIDTIIDEYDDGGKLYITFEGTDDEFQEILHLIEDGNYNTIEIEKGKQFLENARDILPNVIEIFNKTVKIIPEELSNDSDLVKFKESSSNQIPLVILGNYSSGKSTFINALIGSEILPNSDHPVTAKIFKIKKSLDSATSKIEFKVGDTDVEITVNNQAYEIAKGHKSIEPLIPFFENKFEKLTNCSNESILHILLETLNEFDTHSDLATISDLISIEVPFQAGVIGSSSHDYVIFDTPGSNSSSNKNHFEVLKKALRNMSNGLTIFLSEYTSLDTIDNENLYDELHSIKEIDSRFTLIVVNKADIASIDWQQVHHILEQAIPKNLYSEGIFFVSSIMGLGAKTGGLFTNDNYDRNYKKAFGEFSDVTSEYYQRLFHLNIVPEQLKNRLVQKAETSNLPLVYVNSGLFSLEDEIETFSQKYAAYNKCQQTSLYLEKIIEKTNFSIEQLNESTKCELQKLEEELEKNKSELISKIKLDRAEKDEYYEQQYTVILRSEKPDSYHHSVQKILEEQCESLFNLAKEEFQVEKYRELSHQKSKKALDNFKYNIQSIPKDLSLSNLQTKWKQTINDQQDYSKGNSEYKDQMNKAYKKVSDELIDFVNKSYKTEIKSFQAKLYQSSISFLEESSNQLKVHFARIIGNAEGLPLEKREDLRQLIFDYDSIQFEDEATVFSQDHFIAGIRVGDFVLFGNKNKLNLDKLSANYTNLIAKETYQLVHKIKLLHFESFKEWTSSLVDVLEANIVEFSPNLQETNIQIINKNLQIEDYETKLSQLKTYSQEMKSLLIWKDNA